MAQRKRLALIFKVDRNWMGGTYYVLNIINALKTLPEDEQPEILLLCESKDDFNYALEYTHYPHIQYRETFKKTKKQFIIRCLNKISKIIIGGNRFFYNSFNEKVDVIYPVTAKYQINSKSPKLYWIPDFQELYLPEFFDKKIIESRKLRVKEIIKDKGHIVFSSNDALNSFNKFYPEGKNLKKDVYRFTTTLDEPVNASRLLVTKKYNAPKTFFYCPNQFWTHKNHRVLFEAVKLLKDKGEEICVFCSGGTKDYRNKKYFESLTDYIEDNNLQYNIHILGFVDRQDQLALIQECVAIIQPSLFEGWSTSVEEAKAMDKFMILSDLPLLKEQVLENGYFFKRDNPEDLARTIVEFIQSYKTITHINYSEYVLNAAKNFLKIIER